MGCLLSFVLFTQSRDLSHFILKVTHSLHLRFFTFSAGERNRHPGPGSLLNAIIGGGRETLATRCETYLDEET